MGDIGKVQREVTFEPVPEVTPAPEPVKQPEPQPA